MKKKYLAAILLVLCFLTSCNVADINKEEISINLTPKSTYNQITNTDVGVGFLHKKEQCLHFFDYETIADIPLCSKPNCKHNNETCDTYFTGKIFVYNNMIFELKNVSEYIESKGWTNHFIISKSDINGQHRQEILKSDYLAINYIAYLDKLYIACRESYYIENDDLYTSSPRSKVYLMEISFVNDEIIFFSECINDAFYTDAFFYDIYDGELYFCLNYLDNFMTDVDGNDLNANQYSNQYKFNLNTHKITENNNDFEPYIFKDNLDANGNCITYYKDNTIYFQTMEKTSSLIFECETQYNPISFDSRLKIGSDIYFEVIGNNKSIFKYDLNEEKLYESTYNNPKANSHLKSVFIEGYIFVNEDEIYMTDKNKLDFFEVDENRLNEICENYNMYFTNN